MRKRLAFLLDSLLVAVILLTPNAAAAQAQAGLSGTVMDSTGSVLPGVLVEARSPALIEQVRTAVTDGAGKYSIISLEPGTYSVTFTLTGFNKVVREGVELQGAFIATIDGELTVGSVSELITVTAASPVVDVVSSRQQTVMTAQQVHMLPGAVALTAAHQYVPGAGGSFLSGPLGSRGAQIHGSDGPDGQTHVDGIRSGNQLGGRNESVGGIGLVSDEALISEMVFDTAAQGAEYAQSGVRTNMIPKSGSNDFDYEFYGSGGHQKFISSNLTPELESQGIRFAPQAFSWTLNGGVGGPIKRNKLWFFGSFVENRSKTYILDSFFDPNEPSTPKGVGSDLRAFSTSESGQQNVRVTHQLTQRNKLTYAFVSHRNNFPFVVGTGFGRVSPEALFNGVSSPTNMTTVRWTAPVTSRLFLETTFAYQRADLAFKDHEENGIGRVPFIDPATGRNSGTSILQDFYSQDHKRNVQAAIAYVTGSHSLKAGLNWANNLQYFRWKNNGDIYQATKIFGVPQSVLVMTQGDALDERNQNCDCGIYAQDAWTIRRLTLNLGLRYDWFNSSLAGGPRPAGFFSPALDAEPIEDLPDWHDWNGRFGAAYNLFNHGKTAVKVSAGRYVANEGLGITQQFSPYGTQFDFRFWTDRNGDGAVINSDGTPQFTEIGPSFNPRFGTPRSANRLDPELPRGSNMEYTGGVEHEIIKNWSISGMWHRRRYSNFKWQDNTSLNASAYRPLTFTAPSDPRLPNGGGEAITVYEFLTPNFPFSAGDVFHTLSDDWRTWNGFEVIVNGRLWRNGFVTGSWTAGKSESDFCTAPRAEAPNALRFCQWQTPYRHSGKVSGALPLPFDTMISGLFQVFAGQEVLANYLVTAADIGRPINVAAGSGDATISVPLIERGTKFEDATTSLLLRFSKDFTTGQIRTRAYMNASNLFNTLTVTGRNQFFGGGKVLGPDFFRPISVSNGRALSFGFQTFF